MASQPARTLLQKVHHAAYATVNKDGLIVQETRIEVNPKELKV